MVCFQLTARGQSGVLGKTVLLHAEVVRRRKSDHVQIQNHNTVGVIVLVMALKQRFVIINTVQVGKSNQNSFVVSVRLDADYSHFKNIINDYHFNVNYFDNSSQSLHSVKLDGYKMLE